LESPNSTILTIMPPFPRQKAPKGSSATSGGQASAAEAKSDSRFAALATDPRYRLPSKKNTHVKLDKRFKQLVTDEEFGGGRKSKSGKGGVKVDRYGRKIKSEGGKAKGLERFYEFEDEEDEEEWGGVAEGDEADDDEEVKKELARFSRAGRKYDPARDGGFSQSESETDSSDEDSDSDESIHLGRVDTSKEDAELEASLPADGSAVPTGEVTRRLAVVNLDWDNVRAADIFAVASSFVLKAADGERLLDVTVYPSEFGRERMEREETEGPAKEIFQSVAASGKKRAQKKTLEKLASVARRRNKDDDSDSDSDGGSEEEEEEEDSEEEYERIKQSIVQDQDDADFDSTALRTYQLQRLRYYYAVITCSSPSLAKKLYDEMDGQEYLSSANFFDLRFVPDETDFSEDKPRDSCVKLEEGYKPTEFTTDALMHSKVKLTWDAEDGRRKDAMMKVFGGDELDEREERELIASGSSSEEEEDEILEDDDDDVDVRSTMSKATSRQDRADALRTALGDVLSSVRASKKSKGRDAPAGGMQITFTPALSSGNDTEGVFAKGGQNGNESTMEKYVRKEKERKARRKEKSKASRQGNKLVDSSDDGSQGEDAKEKDPFDDPFFDSDENGRTKGKKDKKKKSKVRFEDENGGEDLDDERMRRKQAELELIMQAEPLAQSTDGKISSHHFDMREQMKAEKAERKKQKKQKHKAKAARQDDVSEANEQPSVDLKDPRFSALYHDPEFAIDPTSHKFRDTKGIRAILDEKRKRSRGNDENDSKRDRNGGRGSGVVDSELGDLVESVRKKQKVGA
jgi:hypothetical protein